MSDSLMPPSATIVERAMEMAAARIESVPTPARHMWNPQTCPAQLLPWLAWAFSVDEWDTTWTEAQKRATIAASYNVHRRKGTIGAVKRALGALGLDIQIVEWFQETPKEDPYTFRIALGSGAEGAPQDKLLKLLAVLNSAKNLRSHLRSIDLTVESKSNLFPAGYTLIGNEIQINSAFTLKYNGLWKYDGSQKYDGHKR